MHHIGGRQHLGSNTLVLKVTSPIQETHPSTIERTTHRWSHWLLICFICLISSLSLTHQTHRVINPVVEQSSIATLQLDPIGVDSSDIIVGLGKKSQHKSSNALVTHSHLDLQRGHKNHHQRQDKKSEEGLHPSVLHRHKKHPQQNASDRRPRRFAVKQASLRGTIPRAERDLKRKLHQSCRHSQRSGRSPPKPIPRSTQIRGSAPTLTSICTDKAAALKKGQREADRNKPRRTGLHRNQEEILHRNRKQSLHQKRRKNLRSSEHTNTTSLDRERGSLRKRIEDSEGNTQLQRIGAEAGKNTCTENTKNAYSNNVESTCTKITECAYTKSRGDLNLTRNQAHLPRQTTYAT